MCGGSCRCAGEKLPDLHGAAGCRRIWHLRLIQAGCHAAGEMSLLHRDHRSVLWEWVDQRASCSKHHRLLGPSRLLLLLLLAGERNAPMGSSKPDGSGSASYHSWYAPFLAQDPHRTKMVWLDMPFLQRLLSAGPSRSPVVPESQSNTFSQNKGSVPG